MGRIKKKAFCVGEELEGRPDAHWVQDMHDAGFTRVLPRNIVNLRQGTQYQAGPDVVLAALELKYLLTGKRKYRNAIECLRELIKE